ncbi:DUF6531 domain-containing protein [Salinibacterium sp. SYSU T00001]|uniref:RHS repeat-associated core domain-containing protein n=1 Tax=Homoserinimonas sedimenticola TaxID=2986805 RepID=UPI00223568D6|nr:RHS repeat-associated core domain-containing protein [Salinibacterium sedimenticola]MCW4384905.1 DUF6531 domain-containing protein [Salinibacterium sedimenticola]
MRSARNLGLLAIISISAVLVTSTGVSAMPSKDPDDQSLIEVPDTPYSEGWVPEAAAGDAVIPEPAAPEEAWEAPAEDRVLGERSQLRRAPVGTVVGAPGLGALPYFAFDETEISVSTIARVNLANGNLLLTANEGMLHGPGLSVRNDRFYNGLSSSVGSFGAGWSSPLSAKDVGLAVTSTTATFTGPNGFTAQFTRSGSAWVTPAGFNATLTDEPYSKVLTYNQTGERVEFNSSGWIIKNENRNGVGATYSYTSGAKVASVTEASGRSYTITWGTAGGADVISSITDSAGRTVTYSHNSSGQLTRVDSPGGLWEEYSYDAAGRLTEIRTRGTSAAADTKAEFVYDAQHRVVAVERMAASSSTSLSTTSYAYASGQTALTDPRGKVSTFAIDSSGRVTSVTDPLNRTRSQTWTPNSDVATTTDALASGSTPGNTTTYSYDALNNAVGVSLPTGAAASAAYATGVGCAGTGGTAFQPKCTTDAAGNGKAFEYDAAGNLTKVTDTTAGGTGAVPEQYTYETNGAVCGGFAGQVCTSTNGNGHTTSYAYDADGNLATVTPPAPQGPTTYTHDSLGRVLTVTDGNGDTTTYGYNVRDEIVSTTFDGGQTLTTSYYFNGLKSKDTDSTGPFQQYAYDVLGRMTVQQIIRSSTVNMFYDYDAAGNMTGYYDAIYGQVTYAYDDANQLVRVIEPGGACTSAAGSPANSGCIKFGYDANGNETRRTFPGNAGIDTSYDAAGRILRIRAKDTTGAVKVDIGYSYTAPGGSGPAADRTAIQTRTSHAEEGITAGAITTYGYDSLNRLATATEKVGATTSAWWAYAYDNAGNRTQQVRTGATGAAAGTIDYTYDAAGRLTAATADTTSWAYDAAGNQTVNGITGQTATYNSRGAVTGIGSGTYDSFGKGNTTQLGRVASSTTTSYLTSGLGLMGEELSGAVGSQRGFTRTPEGDAVGARLGGGSRYYYVTDHQGSVVGMFSKTGTYYGGYSYSPYGEQRAISSNVDIGKNNLRYISGYFDEASGLYKLGARYYDASTGRFTQFDPSGQEANPYAYAGCNPVVAADPTGLATWQSSANTLLGHAIGGLIGGAITATCAVLVMGLTGGIGALGVWGCGVFGTTSAALLMQDYQGPF